MPNYFVGGAVLFVNRNGMMDEKVDPAIVF
jgi:hypothetical protein